MSEFPLLRLDSSHCLQIFMSILPLLNFESVAGQGEASSKLMVTRLCEQTSWLGARQRDPQIDLPPSGCNPQECWISVVSTFQNLGDLDRALPLVF